MMLATTPGHCMARCSAAWPPLVTMFTTLPSCRRIFSTAATSPCENIYSHIKNICVAALGHLEGGDVEEVVTVTVGGEERGGGQQQVEHGVVPLHHCQLGSRVTNTVRDVHISTHLGI